MFLYDGCYTARFSFPPKNWLDNNAATDIKWYIAYRFYDPSIATKGKQIALHSMNEFLNLKGRQTAIAEILESEHRRIVIIRSKNPFQKQCEKP